MIFEVVCNLMRKDGIVKSNVGGGVNEPLRRFAERDAFERVTGSVHFLIIARLFVFI
jgi:hypothetical protein